MTTQTPVENDPVTVSTAAPPRPVRPAPRPRRKKGEGQWALGYREPLNPNEQSKKDDNPLNVRSPDQQPHAKRGFASIDPADLRGRFRWYGLYTQRRPGITAGRRPRWSRGKLDDEYFMLRIRIDGGALRRSSCGDRQHLGDFARDSAGRHRPAECPVALDPGGGRSRDMASARGGRPEYHRGLRCTARGVIPARRCRDRGWTRSSPTRAIRDISEAPHRRSAVRPTCRASTRRRSPAIRSRTWCRRSTHRVVGVEHPSTVRGFDLGVGGGLVDQSDVAVRLGGWVPEEEVGEVGPE